MSPAELPQDFAWTWQEGTVRVDVPPMVETAQHVYETVLSRADAERLVAAVWDRATGGGVSGPLRAPTRMELVHDPRYAATTLSTFREKVLAAMSARGLRFAVDLVAAGGAARPGDEPASEMSLEPDASVSGAPPVPSFPPEPVLPKAAPLPLAAPAAAPPAALDDPGSDTDLGLDDDFERAVSSEAEPEPEPESASRSEPDAARESPTGEPPGERRPDRPSRQGNTPSWRRRFEKKDRKRR